MMHKSMHNTMPERPDSPTFTCEVCKISVRSAQKLLDHVNFSPLHKAALEGSNKTCDTAPLTPSSKAKTTAQRLIIYDGTKLFWRINETLEICIYEDAGANSVTITAFQQQSAEQIPPILLDLCCLMKALGLHEQHNHMHAPSKSNSSELVSKYLLARLQAKKDPRGSISLFLHKLHEHETDPALLLLNGHGSHGHLHSHHGLPTDLAVRRRHTIDDVKEAQKEVRDAAVELKKARVQAESLSNMARLSLEAFSKRNQPEVSRKKSEWLRAYDRVTLKNAVDYNKMFLQKDHEEK